MPDYLKRFLSNALDRSSGMTRLVATLLLSTSILTLAMPAQAGIFDFLFGGRENRRGRAPNRSRGGAVRTGRLTGGVDDGIPYIITPRNTFQVNDEFDIHWNPVDGTTEYTVKLWLWQDANGGREKVVWTTSTTEPSTTYGGEPLSPESFYSIEVVTGQGVSSNSDPGCAISGFALLFPDMNVRLDSALDAIDVTLLTDEQLALATAEVYLNYQMPDYAIATLSDQLTDTPAPTLYLALGDLYSFVGLNNLAIAHYTEALALATATNDYLWQALALEGLGEIKVTLNQIDIAIPQLQRAEVLYAQARNNLKATQMERRLQFLRQVQQLNISPTEDLQDCASPAVQIQPIGSQA